MELSGHLDTDSLNATADELVDTLVRMVADAGERTERRAHPVDARHGTAASNTRRTSSGPQP
ncbi:hypothetical protein [Streptomyces sp. NPDC058295]|uniref:hypothetical protein n=1 Tax=Streptomyces sp. NPDC058295 TaxID=3346431 RepID=UPI0036F077F2